MMFLFPNFETLRLALGGGQIPPEMAGAPVEAVFSADRLSVQSPQGSPSKTVVANLKKLGVTTAKEHYSGTPETFLCWAQLLPTTKSQHTPELGSNTPILFEMSPEEFPELVNEMLRLGNDRQSFRTMADADGSASRVLLKVLGPPYYTLLRAIDRVAPSTIVAYSESSPGLWIQYGHTHPLLGQLKPPAGQHILMRAGRGWTVTDDAPYADIYEALDVVLPENPVEWQESTLKGKLVVPLRLVPGNAADLPDFWVVTEDAVNQLDALVRNADDRLMQRLAFAIASNENGPPTIVLKTRPSKLQPPALPLDNAIGFKPFWKLPNLFLPVGKRLMPTLRREAVRKLLAEDPAQVVWLMPTATNDFTPETLPDTAFRPLEDWIDYVIDHDREALASWVRATQFDFESFLCKEENVEPPKDAPPPNKKGKGRKDGNKSPGIEETKDALNGPSSASSFASSLDRPSELPAAPSELRVKREQMEQDFLAVTGPLDADERVRLWPELARLNASLNDLTESAICWTNALWEETADNTDMVWAWLRSEDRDARKIPTDIEFDLVLSGNSPSGQQVRALAVRTIYACGLDLLPASLTDRLPAIRAFLEQHEGVLGARTVWLAWHALSKAADGSADVLALARVRDRLLSRLFTEGLNKERDLPYFLRAGGEQSGERMRGLRERAMRLFRLVEKWHHHDDVKVNRPYVELMFAFGFAKLGEITTARDLMNTARSQLLADKAKGSPDQVHEFLGKAFCWRIENAIKGETHAGPLPDDMMNRLAKMDDGRNNLPSLKYVVDRMREEYWTLEPDQKTRAYATWYGKSMELLRAIADLANVKDQTRLEEAIRKLTRSATTPEGRLAVYAGVLPHAARAGESLAVELLTKVPVLMAESQRGEQAVTLAMTQCQILERAIHVAGHFNRTDLVRGLFDSFLDFVKRQKTPQAQYDAINRIAGEGIRNLRRLGLRDEIDRFLKQIADSLLGGKPLDYIRRTAGASWPDLLCALLNLAEGWQFFGAFDQARPILDEARSTIYGNAKEPKDKRIVFKNITRIVQAYISASAHGPIHDALNRIEELFQHLEKLPNTYTTASHFSRLHLDIVEEIVRSLIHDNLADSGSARRWLDEDEYLVRRRIHSDFQVFLDQSKLA
ncbi:hypothetical protein [Zavarzinella formosa]|uniref:hypothetical protein n=1 Tax=Zavarzinella formosa TaxID=360055 RepID=UPI000302A7CB|nr:hypothetical protein [Zavarzinella formosa]